MQQPATPSVPPRHPLAFLLAMSRPYRLAMWGAIAFSVIAQALSTSVAFIFGRVVDAANHVAAGEGAAAALFLWVIAYPAVVGGNELFWRASGFTGMRWSTGIRKTAYTTLFEYLSRHSFSFFSRKFAGALGSSINNAVNGLGALVEAFLWNYLPTLVAAVGTLVFAFYTDVYLGFVFFAWIAVLIPVNIFFARRVAGFSEASAENQSKMRGFTVDIISNMVAVHAFARRLFEVENIEKAADEQRGFALRSWIAAEILLLVNSILLALFASVVVLSAYHFWREGVLTLGQFVTALTLVGNVTWFVLFIGSALNSLATNIGEIRNGLLEIIQPHEVADVPGALGLAHVRGAIAFSGMSFAYDTRSIFENFSLTVTPGERIGIVGPSGSGKTTLMSLLLRHHDVTGGSVSIDGTDVRTVTLDSLHRAIASVPQDPYLFHRTIRENIRYGKDDASDVEVEEAAKKAQAHEFIMALPQGYDTLVGERGIKLSGGQRQRIAIARGILKGAPILVLDEATSSLDSESESAIQEALKELMKGKTVLAIAHRLSTIRAMDRILVIENGKVVEDGTHETLLREGGVYTRLWEHQAGGFLPEEGLEPEEMSEESADSVEEAGDLAA